MTQILARSVAKSVLILFASSALSVGSVAAAPGMTHAVLRSGDEAPQLILAATHHKKKHATAKAGAHKASSHSSSAHKKGGAHHRKGHHAAAAAPADDQADSAPSGAAGHVIDDKSGGQTYKVKKGDNLQKVADKLGTDVAELKKINKIKGTAIRAGQVLKGPGGESKVYVAARGDTVAAIAKRMGVTEKALKAENGFSRRGSALKAGQHVKLPEGYRDHGAPKSEAAPSSRLRGRIAAPPVEEDTTPPSEDGRRAVAGRLTEVSGPSRSYRVRRGDTLDKVADKLGVSVAQLKKQNHLRKTKLRPGQTLHAPGGMVKAYVVSPSDTTYGIARRFGVTIEALRAANGMGRRGTIHTGEKLRLPSGWRDHGPQGGLAPERPATSAPRPYVPPAEEQVPRPSTPQPYTPPAGRPGPTVVPPTGPVLAPQSSPSPTDAQISEIGRGKFLWPIRGEVLSEFGPKAGGQRNDGINIQANTGDPVRAAASGEVVYAGDLVPGYGNLVLIGHPDGWVTAYSHLSKVEVKMKQKITQGQEIGLAGATGGVAEPQLHFEVRYYPNPQDRAKPVDPRLVLPK